MAGRPTLRRLRYSIMRVLQNVQPTSEQLAILNDVGLGFRLIRGAAGSGKTTTALMRVRQLCSARLARKVRLAQEEPVRVLVLTFNRTLRGYIEHLVTEQVDVSADLNLTVDTFSHWALNLCRTQDKISSEKKVIRSLLITAGIVTDLEYFIHEVQYIMGRFLPDDRNGYIHTQRTGRGRAPAVTRQTRTKLLTDVIEPYENKKVQHGTMDWNDLAIEAAKAKSPGYDVVVVDETQDLSANQVRAVLAHLRKDHTTTFIIDAVQRIYPQVFRWVDIGLTIRPNMVFALTGNHRNTVEISQFAASITRGLPDEEDGVLPNVIASGRHGPPPEVIAGTYGAQLKHMLDYVNPRIKKGESVAILQTRGRAWFDFARAKLIQRNIPFCELTRESNWPDGPEQVALSTMHSAKGLEFDHVLLPGLNQEVTPHSEEEGHGTLDSLRRLIAMSIGRARKTVSVGYKPGKQSTLISLMDPATYNMVKVN